MLIQSIRVFISPQNGQVGFIKLLNFVNLIEEGLYLSFLNWLLVSLTILHTLYLLAKYISFVYELPFYQLCSSEILSLGCQSL